MKYIIKFATRFIPRHHLHKVSHFFLKIISWFYRGSRFEDPITGIGYRKMLSYGRVNSRANALSPDSMSLERHRLFWLYLKEKTDFFTANKKLLHIAPEYCFIKLFKSMKNIDYTSGDLYSPWADVKMDVHEITFEDNTFDVLFANHILEHVDDEMKVMSEFYRVLKPGGWGIFQSPIDYTRETTYSDDSITDKKEREKHFWQDDHLRLFGRDYKNQLSSVGFDVNEDKFVETLDPALVTKYCLTPNEYIYMCTKPKA